MDESQYLAQWAFMFAAYGSEELKQEMLEMAGRMLECAMLMKLAYLMNRWTREEETMAYDAAFDEIVVDVFTDEELEAMLAGGDEE